VYRYKGFRPTQHLRLGDPVPKSVILELDIAVSQAKAANQRFDETAIFMVAIPKSDILELSHVIKYKRSGIKCIRLYYDLFPLFHKKQRIGRIPIIPALVRGLACREGKIRLARKRPYPWTGVTLTLDKKPYPPCLRDQEYLRPAQE
jgi:hypothetical protein